MPRQGALFQREGRSIVIVSHALDVVRQLCDRAVMLDHGRVHAIGSPDDVVREMRLTILHHDLEFAREEGSKEVEIVHVELLRDDVALQGPVRSGETLTVQLDLRAAERVVDPVVSFALHDATNSYVFGDDTARLGLDLGTVEGQRRIRFGAGPDPSDRRQVLDHPRGPFPRQRTGLPRAGRALFVRSAAGGRPPRPTLDPRHGPDGGPVSDTTTTPTQKGDRRMTIGLILVSVTLAAIAQVTLKMGMNHVTDANGGQLALSGESLKQILTTLLVWVGLGIFAISAVLWLFALSRASLSFAYPFAALGYVIIVAASILFLDEHVPPLGWAGVGCIVVGILLVAQGSPQG